MEQPSPARLYATVAGALLTILGIIGFFYSGSFGSPGEVGEALGAFDVNGWQNAVHLVTGLVGLVAVGYAARACALGLGAVYLALALWGFVIGGGESILGVIPANAADNVFHLLLGLAGLGAGLATPARPKAPA
jgi:hypothetical protein